MTSFSKFSQAAAQVAPIKSSTPASYPVYVAPVRIPTANLPELDVDTLPRTPFWSTLGRALTLRRDHESATEAWFVAWLVNRLPVTLIDTAGNLHVDLRTDPSHRSMFTAHTDSVHNGGGINKVHVDGDFWRAGEGHALGGDDGGGVALLCHMIDAKIPGYYMFFRGEERGGVGSSWVAKNLPQLFSDLDRAVAFDRAGYSDVITHQSGGRCCSDVFADALANALSTEKDWFIPDSTGVYTDTAEFTRLIPECTNVSIGYKNQHGDREELNVAFLKRLADTCLTLPWDDLPVARDPKVRERPSRFSGFGYNSLDYGLAETSEEKSYTYTAVDPQENPDYDDEVYELYRALEEASEFQVSALADMIAKAVCPGSPNSARVHLNLIKLDQAALDLAEEMLDGGWGVDDILLELYELCATP